MENNDAIIVDFNDQRYLIPISILADNISVRAFSHCPTHYDTPKKEAFILQWLCDNGEEILITLFKLYPKGTEYILKSCLYEN